MDSTARLLNLAKQDERMTNEELISTLSTMREKVAVKSRSYAATLKTIDELLKALRDPGKNPLALNEAVGKFRKLDEDTFFLNDRAATIGRLDEIAKREMDNSAFTFKRDLMAAFEEKKISLEASGRDRFFADPLRIEVDTRSGKVDIMYGHNALNSKPIPLDPARVATGYLSARKSLVERKSNPADLLKKILEAYTRLIAV